MENIVYTTSLRCRSIRIKITAAEIRVSVPPWVSQRKAEQFVADNMQIILDKQAKLQKRAESEPDISPENPLQTLTFKVIPIPKEDIENIQVRLKDGELTIFYPARLSIAQAQPYFWNSIRYFLRKEAKRILPQRVEELARQHGFNYADVKIQASRSRWGSCSAARNINLSFYLLLAKQELVDYVILHELCHTVEMNHGTNFWALMDKVTNGRHKEYRQALKQIKIPAK